MGSQLYRAQIRHALPSITIVALTIKERQRRLVLMSTIIPIHIDRPTPNLDDEEIYEDDEDQD